MKKAKGEGFCALTGKHGRFVKSHLLPRALTRLSRTGERFIETGIGVGFKRRADSWYDPALCTREGEDILEGIDTRGIEELRRHRLVWSSWNDYEHTLQVREGEHLEKVFRFVPVQDPSILRLFFLSLLWRSAASKLPEFADIELSPDDLEDLRLRLVRLDPGNPEDYPIQLFQIISRGPAHNRTPLIERKLLLEDDGSEGAEISYARFYIDGLVSHIHLARRHDIGSTYKRLCFGFSDPSPVFCHEFLESRTIGDLREMMVTVAVDHHTIQEPLHRISTAIREAWPPIEVHKIHGSLRLPL